jgi:hypothetical protein
MRSESEHSRDFPRFALVSLQGERPILAGERAGPGGEAGSRAKAWFSCAARLEAVARGPTLVAPVGPVGGILTAEGAARARADPLPAGQETRTPITLGSRPAQRRDHVVQVRSQFQLVPPCPSDDRCKAPSLAGPTGRCRNASRDHRSSRAAKPVMAPFSPSAQRRYSLLFRFAYSLFGSTNASKNHTVKDMLQYRK